MSIKDRIHELEAQGFTGKNNIELDNSTTTTDSLSDQEIIDEIHSRACQGKPIGKLIAAANEREIDY